MNVSAWLLVLTGLIWLSWDVVAYWQRSQGRSIKTISMVITEFSFYSPALPFVLGVLCGHWFWPA